jgi:hypothetical protein
VILISIIFLEIFLKTLKYRKEPNPERLGSFKSSIIIVISFLVIGSSHGMVNFTAALV